jgi:hypothetical protein
VHRRLIALVFVAGCASSQGEVVSDPAADHWVREIELSQTRGEVGKPFTSKLTFDSNYVTDADYSVSGLPPGLRWDEATASIVGTPKRDGFFTVNVAVRKKVERGRFHKPKVDERWWPQEIEISIYKPMK